MKKKDHHHSKSILTYLKDKDTFFATIAVFVIMGLLALLPINTHVLDPFKLALHDFNYNDLVYSKMDKHKDFPADTNIVIVNIGDAGRPEIAAMIDRVMEAKPTVAGLDVLFNVAKDSLTDDTLRKQFSKYSNLVTAYKLDEHNDKFSASGYFLDHAKAAGFANFVGEEEGVIRYITPVIKEEDKYFDSFSAAILKIADSAKYQKLKASGKKYEIINYRRSQDKFMVVDAEQLMGAEFDAHTLKNKIVLMGYIGKSATDIEDKHYTPLNTRFTGRGTPDMYGIFIHSNIIGMEMDNQLIGQTPSWLNWLIAFLVGYISMAFFIKYSLEMHMWFHLIAKTVQIIMAILFVYLGLYMFYKFDTQISMTATLAATILAVDVLYFYQSFALWLHKRFKYQTIFTHETNH